MGFSWYRTTPEEPPESADEYDDPEYLERLERESEKGLVLVDEEEESR